MKKKDKITAEFTVEFSSGWFKSFRNRYALLNVTMSGEFISADMEAAKKTYFGNSR